MTLERSSCLKPHRCYNNEKKNLTGRNPSYSFLVERRTNSSFLERPHILCPDGGWQFDSSKNIVTALCTSREEEFGPTVLL